MKRDLLNLDFCESQGCFHFDYSLGDDRRTEEWETIGQMTRQDARNFIELIEWKYSNGLKRYPSLEIIKIEYEYLSNRTKRTARTF